MNSNVYTHPGNKHAYIHIYTQAQCRPQMCNHVHIFQITSYKNQVINKSDSVPFGYISLVILPYNR